MTVRSWVETHFSAAHRDGDGPIHGHTWRVRATWGYRGDSATDLKAALTEACSAFDHHTLPDHLSRAEQLAEHLGGVLRAARIDVWRDAEGMGATWTA